MGVSWRIILLMIRVVIGVHGGVIMGSMIPIVELQSFGRIGFIIFLMEIIFEILIHWRRWWWGSVAVWVSEIQFSLFLGGDCWIIQWLIPNVQFWGVIWLLVALLGWMKSTGTEFCVCMEGSLEYWLSVNWFVLKKLRSRGCYRGCFPTQFSFIYCFGFLRFHRGSWH